MAENNQDNDDDVHEDQNEHVSLNNGSSRSSSRSSSGSSGDSSSLSSCCSSSSTSNSANKRGGRVENSNRNNTSSPSSDNDDEHDLRGHHQCQKSMGHHDTIAILKTNAPTNSNDQVIDRLQAQTETGQICDNKSQLTMTTTATTGAETNFPNSAVSNIQSAKVESFDEHQRYQQATTSKQEFGNKDTQCRSDSPENTSVNSACNPNEQNPSDGYKYSQRSSLLSSLSSAKQPTTSLGSSTFSELSSNTTSIPVEPPSNNNLNDTKRILRLAPSPSPSLSTIDTNNNKDGDEGGISSVKRNNFSKSASGSRLLTKMNRPCECSSPNCNEKKHSNRRQFIEHYYNSRTQLLNASSTSSFNITTPLNRLSECDAITKRLLSSPIRSATNNNQVESPTRRAQVTEVDKSRRASLGTNTMTDQVYLFSKPFKSLEIGFKRISQKVISKEDTDAKKVEAVQIQQNETHHSKFNSPNDNKATSKQQQGRSLSVCDEEVLNSRAKCGSSNHSSNLNRAISLACESRSMQASRKLLTIIPLFGCDIKSLNQFLKLGSILPPIIDSTVDYILINGILSIGIFRKSGVKSRILVLKQRVETNQNVKFDQLNRDNEFSIYDIADLVKMWFRELKPLPLMTRELIKLISTSFNIPQQQPQAVKRGNSSQQEILLQQTTAVKSTTVAPKGVDSDLKKRINSIANPTHKALLAKALRFLAQISAHCEINQMTSQNLAICLTPSLCATETDQVSIIMAQKALEYCIDNHLSLFD